MAQQRPERNPFLSADIYGVTHINPAKQNSIPYQIPLRPNTSILSRWSRYGVGLLTTLPMPRRRLDTFGPYLPIELR